MSWDQRDLVFLPRLVPHLYPGSYHYRMKARRARRALQNSNSPYARSRRSTLSQVIVTADALIDLDGDEDEDDSPLAEDSEEDEAAYRTDCHYEPARAPVSLDEYAGFEIVSLRSPFDDPDPDDEMDVDDDDPSMCRAISFELQNKAPSMFDGMGAMERVELITMHQESPAHCYGDFLWVEDEEEDELDEDVTYAGQYSTY